MVILKIWKLLQALFLNSLLSLTEELYKSEPSFSSQLCFKGLLIYGCSETGWVVKMWSLLEKAVLFPIDGLIL